jgi:hypothetical protein
MSPWKLGEQILILWATLVNAVQNRQMKLRIGLQLVWASIKVWWMTLLGR